MTPDEEYDYMYDDWYDDYDEDVVDDAKENLDMFEDPIHIHTVGELTS